MNSTCVLYSSSSSKYAELKNLLADLDRLFFCFNSNLQKIEYHILLFSCTMFPQYPRSGYCIT